MLTNEYVDSVFMLPKDVLKYLGSAKKSELKLIMYLFSNNGEFNIEKAAKDLNETEQSIGSALAFWRGTGIIKLDEKEKNNVQEKQKQQNKAVKPEQGSYSTLEVSRARKDDTEFRHIADYIESATGDLMNTSKLSSLFYLYDTLGMQSDVIMGIVAHCVSEGKTKIRYIVKAAEGIHNDGVVTYKELESYFASKKAYLEYEAFVKRTIGAGDRALTTSESKLIKLWEKELKIPKELIPLAYEKTISLISKPSVPYMSKILESWHKEGILSAEDAKKQMQDNSEKIKSKAKDEKTEKARKAGFDIDFEDIYEKP